MAPNARNKLLYENDDLDLVDSFSKKGVCVSVKLGSGYLACHVCREVILEDIFLADTIFSLVVGYRTKPIIYVNGEKVPDELAVKARSNQTLLSFLRDVMKLRGSKL